LARIRFNLLIIDSWEFGETINIKVDGFLIKSLALSSLTDFERSKICGNQVELDFQMNIIENFSHNANLLELEIFGVSKGNNDEFWGINRLEIVLYKCHPSCKSCISDNFCLTCEENMFLVDNFCKCMEGYINNFINF
jgi:hypothetical protein